jgi:anaerobic selenocysteine-containing dehydrogenase
VVQAAGERKPEWWIAHRLLQQMGLPNILDEAGPDGEPDPWSKWRHMLERGSGVSLAQLQADGVPVVLPAPAPGQFFQHQVQTSDGLIDCCPSNFAEAIERCHRFFDDATAPQPEGTLLLIHKRDPWMHNSWFANLERMKKRGHTDNPLSLHPADAEQLGLQAGAPITVASEWGQVHTVVEHDDDLMPGVASMVHGWGHAASPRMRVAAANPGANPNALLPIGDGSYEPLSSQAHMTGIPITVSAR